MLLVTPPKCSSSAGVLGTYSGCIIRPVDCHKIRRYPSSPPCSKHPRPITQCYTSSPVSSPLTYRHHTADVLSPPFFLSLLLGLLLIFSPLHVIQLTLSAFMLPLHKLLLGLNPEHLRIVTYQEIFSPPPPTSGRRCLCTYDSLLLSHCSILSVRPSQRQA